MTDDYDTQNDTEPDSTDTRDRQDSDGDEPVYIVPRHGGDGHRRHVHLDEDCQHVQRATHYREAPRASVRDDQLCRNCTGEAESQGVPEGVDPNATRRTLADLDPEDVGLTPLGERDDQELVTDGGAHTCDACGEMFATLTKLRLHEKDDCPLLDTYDEIDPNAADSATQAAQGLLTCQDCGLENAHADYDETADYDGEDYHLVVEFDCQRCDFANENRVVLTEIDEDSIDNLPEHLQPSDDQELVTDGGVPESRQIPDAPDEGDLTRFQWDTLYVLAAKRDQSEYGLGIKRALEAYYGEEVNHGRLYPNLDDLVDDGLLEKSELDKRTNEYTLTDAGEDLIEQDAAQKQDAVDAIGSGV